MTPSTSDGGGRDRGGVLAGEPFLELARARRELEAAVAARDDFLAAASHEIGTPLAIVELAVEGVRRALLSEAPDVAARVFTRLDRARRAARRLARIRDSLLEASRQRSGGIAVDPVEVDVGDLVREVVWDLVDVAARHGAQLVHEVEDRLPARLDRERVSHAIACVIDNALKFGAGRPVQVRAFRRGGTAVVTVADRGGGIAPDDRDRIFEPFERAVSPREFGGLGVGLWTARSVLQASGGDVTVESAPGEGSTFTVRLPLGA